MGLQKENTLIMQIQPINKIYEETDLNLREYRALICEFDNISQDLIEQGFHPIWHKSRPWEWATVLLSAFPESGERVLDVGGCRSILPFFLAKLNCDVTVIDITLPEPYMDLDYYSRCSIEYIQANIIELTHDWTLGDFDCIYSTCTLEHLFNASEAETVQLIIWLLDEWLIHSKVSANTIDLRPSTGNFTISQLEIILQHFNASGDYRREWKHYFRNNYPVLAEEHWKITENVDYINRYDFTRIIFEELITCASLVINIEDRNSIDVL